MEPVVRDIGEAEAKAKEETVVGAAEVEAEAAEVKVGVEATYGDQNKIFNPGGIV